MLIAAFPLVEDQISVYNEGMKRAAWISGLLVIALTATGCGDGDGGSSAVGGGGTAADGSAEKGGDNVEGSNGTDGGGVSAVMPGKIAFTSNRDGNWEVYVMNTDGTNQVNLTNNAARDFEPSFSRDGSKITFISTRDGNREVYVMNADGTNQVRLTNNSALDFGPSFSPNGTKIAFDSYRDGDVEVYVMNTDGTSPVRLTYSAGYDGDPAFSPDGTNIAFTSTRVINQDIYVMNSDGTNPVRLTYNAGFDSSTDEEEWTGTAKVAYKIFDNTNTYVSYSRGYKAGGINLDPTANKFNPATAAFTDSSTFDAEFVNAWEIGVKNRFLDGALTLNTALFYADYSGFQLNPFNGAFFTIDNVNEVISQGIETELFWNIASGVIVTGGVTYADSRYGSDAGFINNASSPTGVTVLDDQRITHAPYW